ncbi:MAG: hypothetical protein ACRYFZ_04670 [Janthinobacterium lividum]
MVTSTLHYRNWTFEVDRELTQKTYAAVVGSGSDTCVCNDCKNYVAYREQVFPAEIQTLFTELGIDYRKEVETFRYEVLPSGLHHIAGWFHFKGRVLAGPDYREPLPGGGHTLHLTSITANFSIGFAAGSDLAYFEDKTGLVQVEFEANIPWVLDKALEPDN